MNYFSRPEIESAIKGLGRVHPFFQVTFLAAKQGRIPVGETKPFRLDSATDEFLRNHYRLHPKSEYFFMPYRGAGRGWWVNPDYASSGLQTVNTQTFRDVFIHPSKSREWGWATDYVETLRKNHLRERIPLWPLVVWVYKNTPLEESMSPRSVIEKFILDFSISVEEFNTLFIDTTMAAGDYTAMFRDTPVEWHEIIGGYDLPPDVSPDKGGILSYLETISVGPVSHLVFKPGSRLNIVTGDNSLGKSFLLDIIWWSLTGNWLGPDMVPYQSNSLAAIPPAITYQLFANIPTPAQKCAFSMETYSWSRPEKEQVQPGLVVYARADGSYAVWDPARRAGPTRQPLLQLSREAVWKGEQGLIEGVVRDWSTWKSTPDSPFKLFENVLARISPPEMGKLRPGNPMKLPFVPYEIPTVTHSYGDVAIIHESAGVKRMIGLAYLIVWVWHHHRFNSGFLHHNPERQLVVLVDELEAHLHPKWQRVILPALIGVFNDLSSELNAQIFIATHSPLVLASAEPVFRLESDKLHSLETTPSGQVVFEELPFVPRGRADEWLRSKAFGLEEPRSRPASDAIKRAKSLQEQDKVDPAEVRKVHQQLIETIPSGDTFWARWILFARRYGVV